MNILSVLGSPNRNGSTAILMKYFLKGMRENIINNIEELILQDYNIAGCNECKRCKTKNSSCCSIDDDMNQFYGKVRKADILVFATPIYWSNLTSQLKAFIDRLYFLEREELKNKKLVLLMTYDDEEPNIGAWLVEESLRNTCKYLNMELVYVHGVCMEEQSLVNENDLKKVYSMGKELSGLYEIESE